MFRLLNSHLQPDSLQVKSQDAVHTLGSQCVYISEILKPDNLPKKVKRANCVTKWLKYIFFVIFHRACCVNIHSLKIPTNALCI